MVEIRVKHGACGIICEDERGIKRYKTMTAASGPFFVDEARAASLVRLGMAAYTEPAALPVEDEPDDGEVVKTEIVTEAGAVEIDRGGHLNAEQLESMTHAELKKLAAAAGVKPAGNKKADLIAAIAAVEIEVDPDDVPPALSAIDPE